VAGWGEEDDVAAIRARAELIDGLAKRIEEAITATAETSTARRSSLRPPVTGRGPAECGAPEVR
jgi:hypothetical protein